MDTKLVTPELLAAILEDYTLEVGGLHGVGHWARVLENGVRVAEASGGNVAVVKLFAVFHDSRRFNDGHDPDHGARGAELATAMHGDFFELPDDDLDRLVVACEQHTDVIHHHDVTVQCCFDADRLDLGRVFSRPDPRLLNTDHARETETIEWALDRGWNERVPDFVESEWGVELVG